MSDTLPSAERGARRPWIVGTIIIPGDNEWNDCPDPAKAWAHWVRHFTRFDQRWKHKLPVFRQIGRK